MPNHIKSVALLVALSMVAMSAGIAFAQNSGVDSYRGAGEQVQGNVQGGGGGSDQQPPAGGIAGTTGTAGTTSDGGSLPFTGLDLALIVAVGGVLLAVGLGTRRLLRQPDAA
jgi:hypothetical protein